MAKKMFKKIGKKLMNHTLLIASIILVIIVIFIIIIKNNNTTKNTNLNRKEYDIILVVRELAMLICHIYLNKNILN